jgi:hypothetical protein
MNFCHSLWQNLKTWFGCSILSHDAVLAVVGDLRDVRRRTDDASGDRDCSGSGCGSGAGDLSVSQAVLGVVRIEAITADQV